MLERRRFTRTRMHKNAKVLLGNSSVVDCVVHDLTDAGAGIEIPNITPLPNALDLTFDGGRSIRQARRVWRILNRAGIEFV